MNDKWHSWPLLLVFLYLYLFLLFCRLCLFISIYVSNISLHIAFFRTFSWSYSQVVRINLPSVTIINNRFFIFLLTQHWGKEMSIAASFHWKMLISSFKHFHSVVDAFFPLVLHFPARYASYFCSCMWWSWTDRKCVEAESSVKLKCGHLEISSFSFEYDMKCDNFILNFWDFPSNQLLGNAALHAFLAAVAAVQPYERVRNVSLWLLKFNFNYFNSLFFNGDFFAVLLGKYEVLKSFKIYFTFFFEFLHPWIFS